jgi:hypothetical protein
MVGALLSIRSHCLLRHDRELVVHSFEVIRAADDVLIGSLDAETGLTLLDCALLSRCRRYQRGRADR